MAYRFKRLWGPSAREETRSRLTWTFLAVWQNNTGQRYRLTYWADSRRFQVKRTTSSKDQKQIAGYLDAMSLTEDGSVEASGRTVTAILRARLTPEDIAACTRLSLEIGS